MAEALWIWMINSGDGWFYRYRFLSIVFMPEMTSVTSRVVRPANNVRAEPAIADTMPVMKYMVVIIARQKRAEAARIPIRIF
ncbi:hypothetical protein CR164_07725 [Prosthecochloris marina]|uniref:Uncharacterized protein n=1 Tax=Prosthecochloris marina TaxID=2017681 RepID=A0A317T8G2_9CHLB|nr:hypothetical protein CR164_07725 [Prosthecochloris marina]